MKKLLLLSIVFTGLLVCTMSTVNAQGVGINSLGNAADNSAGLDVNFTNKGLLIPRLTTAQRNAIPLPAKGLQIYNTDCDNFNYNAGTPAAPNWQNVNAPINIPSTPGTISGTAGQTPLTPGQVYSVSAVSGATTYNWTVPTGWTITGGAGTNSITVTTGAGGQNGNITVTASNSCATSAAQTLAVTVTWSCGFPLSINHSAGTVAPVSKTVTYGTVQTSLSGASKCWITQNLGADNQASSAGDATEPAAGWYWQYNRKQGYMHDGTTRTPNTTWITSITDAAWTSANDPCTIELGSGWRIPTSTEWTNADGSPQNWSTNVNTYASVLKLHSGGYLNNSNGVLASRGGDGYYWASTQVSTNDTWALGINDHNSGMGGYNKWFGFQLRCIKD